MTLEAMAEDLKPGYTYLPGLVPLLVPIGFNCEAGMWIGLEKIHAFTMWLKYIIYCGYSTIHLTCPEAFNGLETLVPQVIRSTD